MLAMKSHLSWKCYHPHAVKGCPWFLWPRRSLWKRVPELRRWKAERRGCWMFQGPERRRPVRESGDVSDSGGAGTAHYPESLGRPGWLRALWEKNHSDEHASVLFLSSWSYWWPKRPLTCITGAWLRGVSSIKRRWSLFTAIRRKSRPTVLLFCLYICSCSRRISIVKIFLQPGRDDVLHCVGYSADQACLLQNREALTPLGNKFYLVIFY